MRFIFFFLIVFCFGIASANVQDTIAVAEKIELQYDKNSSVEKIRFDSEKIENFKNDKEFDYSEAENADNWWSRFKRWIGELLNSLFNWLFGDWQPNGFWSFIINILPYLIIGGIIAFIIWLFYKLNPGARLLRSQDKPDVFFTEEEEIIKTKDIKKLIKKALKNQDYRLAVRYYYLLILKKLRDAELIDYEFDKTNTDYFSEITSEEIRLQFKKATTLYDYIWYGSFAVTEDDFQKAEKTFTNLENQIPKAIE